MVLFVGGSADRRRWLGAALAHEDSARESLTRPYGADLSTPRVGDDPLARGARRRRRPHQQIGAAAAAPAPNPNSDGGQQAAPAGHAADRPRSGRRGPRARESMDKEEERDPYGADLSMPRVGDDPVARGGRRRRPHPSSPRPHQPENRNSATAASRRRQRVTLLTDRAQVGAALARASQWIKRRNATPTALVFRCRVLAMTP